MEETAVEKLPGSWSRFLSILIPRNICDVNQILFSSVGTTKNHKEARGFFVVVDDDDARTHEVSVMKVTPYFSHLSNANS